MPRLRRRTCFDWRKQGLASEVVPRKRPNVAMRPRLTEHYEEFLHGRANVEPLSTPPHR